MLLGLIPTTTLFAAQLGAPLPPPPPSNIVVFDTFNGPSGTLESHSPGTDDVGGGWKSIRGDWNIGTGRAFDALGYGEPYVTSINPFASDYAASVDVTWLGGSDAGLVFRHVDNDNYYSAVYTGRYLELRRTLDGITAPLKREIFEWERLETKTIEIEAVGPNIDVTVDSTMLSAVNSKLELGRGVGVLVQRTQNDQFKQIEVEALGSQVSPPALVLPTLSAATLFDDFDGATGLSIHAPDKAPLGASWSEWTGDWDLAGGSVSEVTGSGSSDLRATIDPQLIDADIYTDLTWNDGAAGVVYRYVDSGNWWMTWTTGTHMLTASLDSVDGFILRDIFLYEWGSPGTTRTIRVRQNGHGIRIYVDDADLYLRRIVSDLHEGATEVGLFSKHGIDNQFENFVVLPSPVLPEPDVIVPPGPTPESATPPATPPGLTLFDSFSDFPFTYVENHDSDLAPEFSGWKVHNGRFFSDYDALSEWTGTTTDQRAIIDTGVDESIITSKILMNSAKTGLIFRYRNERNWAMVWYDGFDELLVAKLVQGHFQELERISFPVTPGKTLKFSVTVVGGLADIRLGSTAIGVYDVSELANSTSVGLFSRNVEPAQFDNLSVTAAAVQPDPSGLTLTHVVSDDFDTAGPISIDDPLHIVDLQPTAAGWTRRSGLWEVESGVLTEVRGWLADSRVTIPGVSGDQLISSDVTYEGGRAGLVYRLADNSNWYMLWYSGSKLVFAKAVAGSFSIISETPVAWGGIGVTRNLGLRIVGDSMTALVDGNEIVTITGETDLALENESGLFTHTSPDTRFDNFGVWSLTP